MTRDPGLAGDGGGRDNGRHPHGVDRSETAWAVTFLILPIIGVIVMLTLGWLHSIDVPRVRVAPLYGDCSGALATDPCVSSQDTLAPPTAAP